ncbi:MAG: helix-turn-helix domain-containing protein [Desulfovibrionaceae bacterium]
MGHFCMLLNYRLKVVVLEIPPLRERKQDILPLAHNFWDFYCQRYNKKLNFSATLKKMLEAYHWPGNVRELENVVHAIVVQNTCAEDYAAYLLMPPSGGRDAEDKVPSHDSGMGTEGNTKTYKQAMEEYEHLLLTSALKRCGNLRTAAEHLHMDRSTLFRKLQALKAAGYPVMTQKCKRQ